MATLIQDLRYGLRLLAKNPGFSLTVIVTLGLAIGLNAAIFSLVSGILVREPPVKSPESVFMILFANRARGDDRNPATALEFSALRNQNHAFGGIAASSYDDQVLTGRGDPEHLTTAQVTPNLFELLGVSAAFGRTFSSNEDMAKQQSNGVISFDLWQRKFGADPNVIGQSFALAGQTYTVIGVLSDESKYALGRCAVWTPASFDEQSLRPQDRHNRNLNLFARLKKGANSRGARAETSTILERLAQADPDEKGWTAEVVGLREANVDRNARAPIALLMSVVMFVLLIACANVAGIFLARSATRQNEFAVRASLGAGRWRLIGQLLGEALTLALLSGAFGLLLAVWGVHLLRTILGSNPELAWLVGKIDLDATVLVFTLVVSLLAVLLSGLAPALKGSKVDLQAALKGGATALAGLGHTRMRSTFVIAQLALATVLTLATGASIEIVVTQILTQLGFDPKQMLNVGLILSGPKYVDSAARVRFFKEALRRIQSLPGVQSAGAATALPESGAPKIAFEVEGQFTSEPEQRSLARDYVVSPDYFKAMRIPLLAGRPFALADRAGTPGVIIINQTFSMQFFPKTNPVGTYIRIYGSVTSAPEMRQIVGVVGDVVDIVGQIKKEPQIYEPFLQKPSNEMSLVIRTSSDPGYFAPEVRSSIRELDQDLPIENIRTMQQVFEEKGRGDRLLVSLVGSFTGLSLALAAIGIYGAISYMVTQRTREFGVRLALGAQTKDVLRLVVGRAVFLAVTGAGLGFVGALPIIWILTNKHSGALLRIPLILAAAPAIVLTAAILASYIPARRATKVDPLTALRYE